MQELEANIKSLIIERYGSLKKFSETINMPWTTLDSILKRGMANSNITNVLKITRELGLDAEKIVDGEIVFSGEQEPTTIDGSEYTEDELDEIRQFAEFVKNKRK